jgi:tellurite resistance protein
MAHTHSQYRRGEFLLFLHHMGSVTERLAFLRLASAVTEVDNNVEEREKAFLAALQQQLGVGLDQASQLTVAEAVAGIRTQAARRAVLFELLGVSYCDGHASADEEAFINSVASEFGISDDTLGEIRGLTRQLLDLSQRAEAIVSGRDGGKG